MDLIKKLGLTLIIILFLMSIFKDLTVGTIVQEVSQQEPKEQEEAEKDQSRDKEQLEEINEEKKSPPHPLETDRYEVVSQTTSQGDTVLSIIDSLNQDSPSIHIDQIIQDFQTLNPDVDPHRIQPNTEYLFPKYKKLP